MKLKITIILFFTATAIYSFNLPNGIYQYEMNSYVTFPDQENAYLESGIEADIYRQDSYSGFAVIVENRTFIDPIKSIRITIENNGSIYSPDVENLIGRMNRNGQFEWSSEIEEWGMVSAVSTTGSLTRITGSSNLSEYNGIYYLAAELFSYEMRVKIENGFLTMEPVEEQWFTKPSGGAGAVINQNGEFKLEVSMINHSDINYGEGIERMISHSIITVLQEGRVSENGIVYDYSRSTAIGSDLSSTDERTVLAGVYIASADISENEEINLRPDFPNPDMNRVPDWFYSEISRDNLILSSGMLRHSDQDTAIKLAEIIASANLSYQIETEIKSYLSDYFSETNVNETTKKELIEVIDQLSNTTFPFRIEREEYDNINNTAYVQVSITEEQMIMAIENRLAYTAAIELFKDAMQ